MVYMSLYSTYQLGKTYPLESGLTAESGRLKYSATDKSVQCGVTIQNVQVEAFLFFVFCNSVVG